MRGGEFAELTVFLEIVERGSFARAAAHLGLSSPALSQSMKQLETRLGLRLLNRTTRSVSPTEAGEQLAGCLRPAIDNLNEAVEAINAHRHTPHGRVRITVSRVAAELILQPRLKHFRRTNPDVELEVSVSDRFVDIVRERFDLGIRRGEFIEDDLVARRITDDECFVAVASPEYLAERGVPSTPTDLKTHDCIRIRRLVSEAIAPWRFARGDELIDQKVMGSLIVDAAGVARAAAIDGLGIALLAESFVHDHLGSGELIKLLAEWCLPRTGFFLYRPAGGAPSAAVSSLMATLQLTRLAPT